MGEKNLTFSKKMSHPALLSHKSAGVSSSAFWAPGSGETKDGEEVPFLMEINVLGSFFFRSATVA